MDSKIVYIFFDPVRAAYVASGVTDEEAELNAAQLDLFWCADKDDQRVMMFEDLSDAMLAADMIAAETVFLDGCDVKILNKSDLNDPFDFNSNTT